MSQRVYLIVGLDCDKEHTPEYWVEMFSDRLVGGQDTEPFNPEVTMGHVFDDGEDDEQG